METKRNDMEASQRKADRRTFLKGAGMASLSVAGAALLADAKPVLGQSGGLTATDVEVLNFALNLEYLEAEFYAHAFYGLSIYQAGVGTTGVGQWGQTTGGMKVEFEGDEDYSGTGGIAVGASMLRAVVLEITQDELTHVKLLRTVLGAQAVAKPAINLGALGIGFANATQFLTLARAFEDVGASAYGGAAPLLSSTTLATAARIALTEAYHASALRLFGALNGVKDMAVDALDILPPPVGSKYFDADSEGLTVVRTPSQVLAILYGSATPGTAKGGFFPNGVNGAITTV